MKEPQFKVLLELSSENTISQRALSKKVGLSLGNVNYVIKALIQKGYVKACRFKDSDKKLGYVYILTPEGIKEKIQQTEAFMQRKLEEYERLKEELEKSKSSEKAVERGRGIEG
ncbi:MAG TPA: MarR family EPS-associated transcriptional regulator [Syntrophorhabdaceae bacterium]|jgi:EPS-associated MarR family transcriptional regulator|nr:MarR family EPS-associated transcriptional regulator [Pseudomonadota bacterium]HOB70111.1 MarR family EPS-associated transcriptional regulator [Syntrophorhabdaceae bacterium]